MPRDKKPSPDTDPALKDVATKSARGTAKNFGQEFSAILRRISEEDEHPRNEEVLEKRDNSFLPELARIELQANEDVIAWVRIIAQSIYEHGLADSWRDSSVFSGTLRRSLTKIDEGRKFLLHMEYSKVEKLLKSEDLFRKENGKNGLSPQQYVESEIICNIIHVYVIGPDAISAGINRKNEEILIRRRTAFRHSLRKEAAEYYDYLISSGIEDPEKHAMPFNNYIIRKTEAVETSGNEQKNHPGEWSAKVGSQRKAAAAGQETASSAPPMPTHAELKEAGKLFSQSGRTDIIEHLKAEWMLWIEQDLVTRQEIYKRDIGAYRALVAWEKQPGANLQDALGGHTIIGRSDRVDRKAAQYERVSDMPHGLAVTLSKRNARAREKEGSGRE